MLYQDIMDKDGGEHSLSRLGSHTSSFETLGSTEKMDPTAHEVVALGEKDHGPLNRVHSLVRQIVDDNRSIVEEEKREDLESMLRREFTMEDALRVNSRAGRDEETNRDELESTVERVYTIRDTGELELPPDGGYGWVCCLCAASFLFATWGSNSASGVYLAYYIENDEFPGATRMDFAWIAGICVCMGQVLSPLALILDKLIGFKLTMSIAIVIHTTGYILASFATKLWHLYVTQGVMVGVAYSLIIVPALSILPDWFLEKRALASGLMCMGTGLGGLFYSLTVNALITSTGDQRWSLRFVGITTAVIMAFGVFFIKKRSKRQDKTFSMITLNNATKAMFDPKVLVMPKLWIVSFWFAFSLLGYNMTLFTYASVAVSLGLSQKQASTLTACVNAAQVVGRPLIGFIADRWVGRVNQTMGLNFIAAVLILGFWMQCRTFATLLVCGILLGLCLGAGNVMNPVLTADAFRPKQFGCAWVTLNVTMGTFTLFSEVIALSLRDDSLDNPFKATQIFTGCMFLMGVLILVPLRQYHIKKTVKKRKGLVEKEIEDKSEQKCDQKDERGEKELSLRLYNYDRMLASTSKGYAKRVVYPLKV